MVADRCAKAAWRALLYRSNKNATNSPVKDLDLVFFLYLPCVYGASIATINSCGHGCHYGGRDCIFP
ncbi:hypothetical protein TSUD_273330 [Trifolium subterraneum]|uniref:Uncharacterized protein n=1 Tax=Trifolium subterraneum TaxID=3900 RepID=A0A2Z6MC31_TRISU|nr:hypothetical protein TSUD_273330 [Trifolium subterraneum]